MTVPLRTKRVLAVMGILLVALAVSAVSVRAGFWQWGRHQTRAAAIEAYEANASKDPIPVMEAAGSDAAVSADEEWQHVTVTGTYVPESLTLLRNRPVDGQRSLQLLVWMTTSDSQSVLVNGGWIPVPGPHEDPALPDWPTGEVTVTGILRQADPDDGYRDTGATRVLPAQMPEPRGEPLDGYVLLTEDVPASPVPVPTLGLGSHLAYTFQWYAFALIAPIGGILLARREWTTMGEASTASGDDARDGEPSQAAPVKAAPRNRRKEPSDEDIEDAL